MKTFFFIAALLASNFCTANYKLNICDSVPFIDGMINYTRVVNIDSASKDDLYKRAKNWVVHNYVSPKNVIQVDDKEEGKIICTGTFVIHFGGKTPSIRHTLEIDVKDNKYRYSMTNFYYMDDNANFAAENYPSMWLSKKGFYSRLEDATGEYIKSIIQAMQKPINNNW